MYIYTYIYIYIYICILLYGGVRITSHVFIGDALAAVRQRAAAEARYDVILVDCFGVGTAGVPAARGLGMS